MWESDSFELGGNTMNGRNKNVRGGAALILSMIFLMIFSSLAVAMLTMSSANIQAADKHRQANRALESAQSGLEVMNHWLDEVAMSGSITAAERFGQMTTFLANSDNVAINFSTTYDQDSQPVSTGVSDITINSSSNQSFSVTILPTGDLNIIQMDVTGFAGDNQRTIRVNYNFGTQAGGVFDYGIASRGPLSLSGNVELNGVNSAGEASIYLESTNENEALSIIGSSGIAGDVSIANPDAYVTLQGGQASIGGETGDDAMDHVTIDADTLEFPVPDPSYFEQYVENTFDPDVDDTSSNATYQNIRIPAGTNPTFSGNVTLNGIVYIESPNHVTFTGGVSITGIIVGDGNLNDNSGTNQIRFLGNVTSYPVSDLSDDFGALKNETGTFLIAPGFSVEFGGGFDTLNGAIAANGISFSGNAGGTVAGTVLNYSDTPMTVSGNADIFFDLSGNNNQSPSGFSSEIVLSYNTSSYTELAP